MPTSSDPSAPPRSAAIRGTIAYRGGDGVQIGEERFELIGHPGGHILRAFCEMADIALLRDVTIALDRDWRPLEGFCRVLSGGQPAGVSWITVVGEDVRGESLIAGRGRISESIPLAAPLAYLGLHPLQGDALLARVRGVDAPGVFQTIAAVTNSVSPNGDQDIGLVPVGIAAAFVGRETLSVAAGTFAAWRFAVRWHEDWPAADLWVRADDCVFLLMRWSMIDNWFELAALDEPRPDR